MKRKKLRFERKVWALANEYRKGEFVLSSGPQTPQMFRTRSVARLWRGIFEKPVRVRVTVEEI